MPSPVITIIGSIILVLFAVAAVLVFSLKIAHVIFMYIGGAPCLCCNRLTRHYFAWKEEVNPENKVE